MPAGGPGDHPISDIVTFKLPRYGPEADELILKISALSSRRELYQWWEKEIGWTAKPNETLRRAKIRYAEVTERAKKSGWELPPK